VADDRAMSSPAMSEPTTSKIDRELDNEVALAGDLATRSLVWRSRPTRLEFSFNNLCNLKCVMCAKSDDEPNWVLDKDVGIKFLDDVLPWTLHWTPSANSEPLLNNVDLISEQARKHTVWLHLFSNGTLLTLERYAKIRDRLHKLWISLDAATPETFEKIRVPAKWDPVMTNVKAVLPRALEDGVEVTFNFVLMAGNWHEAAAFVDLVADLGGRACNIQELLPNSSQFHDLKWEGKVDEAALATELERAIERAKARSIDLTLELRPPFQGHHYFAGREEGYRAPLAELRLRFTEAVSRQHPGFCSMATSYLKVNPDGGVFPCCRGPEELRMGDATKQSFDEIWNGPRYREFRKRMFDRDYPEVCRDCYVLVGNPNFQAANA
jgi:radical SAM protein with 4Fe4S-binding SPASM domain